MASSPCLVGRLDGARVGGHASCPELQTTPHGSTVERRLRYVAPTALALGRVRRSGDLRRVASSRVCRAGFVGATHRCEPRKCLAASPVGTPSDRAGADEFPPLGPSHGGTWPRRERGRLCPRALGRWPRRAAGGGGRCCGGAPTHRLRVGDVWVDLGVSRRSSRGGAGGHGGRQDRRPTASRARPVNIELCYRTPRCCASVSRVPPSGPFRPPRI